MLESTGRHGRGVEWRVPEMRRMVELLIAVLRPVKNFLVTSLTSVYRYA